MKNIYKIFFVFLLCSTSIALSAQRYVSGRITDAEDGEPVPGASVFIAGTTVGITADTKAYYRLKIPGPGSYKLTVSHVGYKPAFIDIEPGQESISLDVALQIHELEEVAVTAKVKFRKEDINHFWETILGTLPSKNSIYAANSEAVFFYYNRETKILTVTCREPLQIFNLETGYKVEYVLDRFTHDYNTHITFWEAQYMFRELEPANFKQKNKWERNREKVNKVSLSNFVKALYNNSLDENGFLLVNVYEQKKLKSADELLFSESKKMAQRERASKEDKTVFEISKLNHTNYLSTNSFYNSKTLNIPQDSSLMLICYGKPLIKDDLLFAQLAQLKRIKWSFSGLYRNKVKTPEGPVQIFPDGTFKNTLYLAPLFSSSRITGLNMMLPVEYNYNVDSVTVKNNPKIFPEKVTVAEDLIIINHPENPFLDTLYHLTKRFDKQLSLFPQEKVYLHTDKPYYISGETIWFRAHVVDAATHIPVLSPNFVIVELFNARDSAVCRVKTGLENDMFSGYISIPEDAAEGDYTLRAYTNTMRNLEEDYFFMKPVRIVNPTSRIIRAIPKFEYLTDKKIKSEIRFSSLAAQEATFPESVKVSINDSKDLKSLKPVKPLALYGFNFNLAENEKQNVMLLEAIYEQNLYSKYFKIPFPDDDFDVSFYPEGGQALYGCMGRVAVKAMKRDGTGCEVLGTVYGKLGQEITRFKTDVRGIGVFMLNPLVEETYYAVCTNSKGKSKRFELPHANGNSYALTSTWNKDNLIVKVQHTENINIYDTMCLLVHTRGIVQDIRIIDDTSKPVVFNKDLFPSGVTNLLLLTNNMIPVSERLVFIKKEEDQATVTTVTDKEIYNLSSPVECEVKITDESGEPLSGNFSVSITDDHEVAIDTTSNILTSLLLSSDLRGNISDPAFYLQNNSQSNWALELLMMTQGWRRYNTGWIVRNNYMYPDIMLEKGNEISGTVKRLFTGKPEENASVSLLSLNGEYFGSAYTDRYGWFFLPDFDAPDSTRFILRTTPTVKNQQLELTLNKEWYPERKIPAIASEEPEENVFLKYAEKAEQQYVYEHGKRIIQLKEVTITARKKPKRVSSYYTMPDKSIYEDELDRRPSANIRILLNRLPGVRVTQDGIVYISKFQVSSSPVLYTPTVKTVETDSATITVASDIYDSKGCPAMFLVDDFPATSIDWLDPSDVAQLDLLTSPNNLIAFGPEGRCGVIAIYTRNGKPGVRRQKPNIASIVPLGFQKPVEFYAPIYDSTNHNPTPDFRTTIHWQPFILTNEEGIASFRFYTSDTPTTYSVVIEGITDNGKIIYKKDKIVVAAGK